MIDFSIIFAGFGGQGILSAGKMAAEAASTKVRKYPGSLRTALR